MKAIPVSGLPVSREEAKRNYLREHKTMLDRLSVVYGAGEVVV